MRKPVVLIASLLVVAIVIVLASRTRAATVTGQLIDLNCYSMNKELTANFHPGRGLICAQACAREGFPVGLIATDGKVYEVAGGLAADLNAKLVPHMSHTVTITGNLSDKNGMTVITANDLKVVSKGTE